MSDLSDRNFNWMPTALPPIAMRVVSQQLYYGELSHPQDNGKFWQTQSINEHLDHALIHVFNYLDHIGNVGFDKAIANVPEDLANAAIRILMALELHMKGLPNGKESSDYAEPGDHK